MTRRRTAHRIVVAAAVLCAAASAGAQSPSSFLPPAPDQDAAPQVEPREAPAPQALGPQVATGPGPRFTLRGVRLDGATALRADALAPIWSDLIGTEVTLGALDAIAAEIEAAYRAEGYVLSQATLPPQDVPDGVVTIAVIEGFVDRVAIAGGAANQQAMAADLFAPVTAGRPMRLQTLERAVLLGRDRFGGGVETVIEPSPDTFAAADMLVEITPAPPTGFGSIDNRGSRLYGEWSFATGATSFNLLGLNERLDITGAGALDGSLGYLQGALGLPLGWLSGTRLDGALLEIEADYANGDPDLAKSGAPDEQTLTTHETNLSLGVEVPFIRTRATNLYGSLGLDWQDSDNVTGFGADEITETDKLLVLRAGASWDHADRWGGVSLVEAALRQGIDTSNSFVGGGVTAGVPDFTLVAIETARLQRLGAGPWALWLEGIGQYAWDVLPNSERFALGDGSIGRGYAPGNTTGDSGYGGRIELRRRVDGQTLKGLGEAAELYAFGDYGQTYDRDGDRDGQRWQSLGSAGIGVRWDIRPWLTLTPEIARQLDGRPTDTTDPDLETRFYVSLVGRF